MTLQVFHHNGQLAEFPLDKVTGILLDGNDVLPHLLSFNAGPAGVKGTSPGPVGPPGPGGVVSVQTQPKTATASSTATARKPPRKA